MKFDKDGNNGKGDYYCSNGNKNWYLAECELEETKKLNNMKNLTENKYFKWFLGAVLLLLIVIAIFTCNNEPKPFNVVEPTNPLNEIVKDKDAIILASSEHIKVLRDSLKLVNKPKIVYRKIYVYDSLLIVDTACINSLVTLYNQCAKVDSVNEYIIANQSSQIANLVTVTNNQNDIIDIKKYQHGVDSINEIAYKEQIKLEIKNGKRKYRKGLLQGGAVGLGIGFIGGIILTH